MTKTLITVLAFLIALSAGSRAYSAPQQQITVSAAPVLIVLMNADTTYSAPTTPAWDLGHTIKIFDNTGAAGGANITDSGKCAAGSSTISTNYGSVTLTWTGTCWQ